MTILRKLLPGCKLPINRTALSCLAVRSHLTNKLLQQKIYVLCIGKQNYNPQNINTSTNSIFMFMSIKEMYPFQTFSTCAQYSKSEVFITANNSNTSHNVADEKSSDPILSTMIEHSSTVSSYTEVVPGKGRPPEPPVECCMSGCANCVWITYAEELRDYYNDGNERAREEIEKIDNPSLKAFIKLELGLL